jgi:DNA gyrase subunit A
VQAQEILNMRLQRLTGLERKKLEDELAELRARIDEYRAILAQERLVLDILVKDLDEITEQYGDKRRTQIVEATRDFNREDLITEEEVVVTVSSGGYVKRTALSTYRSQGRGGRGIMGSTAKEGDFVKDLFVASTHDYILFFTNHGRVYWLKVYDLPDLPRTSRGRAMANVIQLDAGEKVSSQVCVRHFDDEHYIIFATRQGRIKKTVLSEFSRPKRVGIIAITLKEGDTLIAASSGKEGDEVILGTRQGIAIRFPEGDARPMGRTAAGVGGISLRDGDEVVDMVVVDPKVEDLTLLTVCENGHGKRTPLSEYRLQGRNGSGTINIRTTERNGLVVALKAVTDKDDLVIISESGIIMRMSAADLRAIGRATQGVRLMNLKEGDKLTSVERAVREESDAPGGEASEAGAAEVVGQEDLPAEEAEGQEDLPGEGEVPEASTPDEAAEEGSPEEAPEDSTDEEGAAGDDGGSEDEER